MINLRKSHPIIKIVNNSFIDLPSPSNISYMWNLGSLLGLCLIIQIVRGLFLAIHFSANTELSFSIISHIYRDVNYGWLIRTFHANGASLFFICLYIHIGRGIYYNSFLFHIVWNSGILIFLITIGTAFVGYVLPWGQISFWGATVITGLISAIPFFGVDIVQWVWGGFSVNNATLTRFFTFHFIFPFIILAFVIIHLIFLHQSGSNNPLGLNSNIDKIPFHPYFVSKDLFGYLFVIIFLTYINLIFPYSLGDPENFIPSNPLVTPIHIQPEWYFLFAYAILRSIPNKLGGVIALLASILILVILPITNKSNSRGTQFFPINKLRFWIFSASIIILTWIGARPVEDPFIIIGQITSLFYFSWFFINPILLIKRNSLIK